MKKVRIAMFIDSLGYESVKKYSFLKEFEVSQPVKMQFGYSSTALPTILTGQKPKVHKHFTLFYFSPSTSPFSNLFTNIVTLLPRWIERNWRIRTRMSKIVKKALGFTGYFQLYSLPIAKLSKLDVAEKKDIFSTEGIDDVKNIADILSDKKVKHHISNYRLSEIENIEITKDVLHKGDVEFVFLYTAELDSLQHNETKDGPNVSRKLKYYEEHIAQMLDIAQKKYDVVEFLVFSDHGMTTYKSSLDVIDILSGSSLEEGIDYEVLLDSTMARFWYKSAHSRAVIHSLFKCVSEGEFLTSNQLSNWGCDFDNNLYGEDIFLVNPGIQIVPCDMGTKPLAGMHGYTPDDKDSDASFLSNYSTTIKPLWVGDFFHIMMDGYLD